jgi:hypothetical protein
MKNPTGKLANIPITSEAIILHNINNIAEKTTNINSYIEFIRKKSTIFNIDNIEKPENIENDKANINNKINNNHSNGKLESKNLENNDDNLSISHYKEEEEIEDENMDISLREINKPGNIIIENFNVKTMESSMEHGKAAKGEGVIEDNFIPQNAVENKSKFYETNQTNNAYYDTHNPTKDLKKNEDVQNYEQKIDELQSQLMNLQIEVKQFFIK